MKFALPEELVRIAAQHAGPTAGQIEAMMRPSEVCATPQALNAQKATRLSFTQMLARRLIDGKWKITKDYVRFDGSGRGHVVYQLDFGKYRSTYVAQSFETNGLPNENLGRRVGAKRDIWGTLFLGQASKERVDEELQIVAPRDSKTMRARSDVLGWTPGSRSARIFDDVVTALAYGRQPSFEVVRKSGYLVRNGGFIASGRYGTLSYQGIPEDHPLKPPYFADLFGLLMLREVGLDLVNGMALARSPRATTLSNQLATFFGVGNASGQGMCVALQRWPQWFSTWVLVREFCLSRAKLMTAPVGSVERRNLEGLVGRAAAYYGFLVPDSEEFTVSHAELAKNLHIIAGWLRCDRGDASWAGLAQRVTATFDAETAELLNALLIEIYPEFADDVASYIPEGMAVARDYSPEILVGRFRNEFLSAYSWELRQDLSHSDTRRHFWYHSIDNGEQRRGERVIDPHEHFESFIDHLGALQRLASVLAAYPDTKPMGEVVLDHPELAFAASRVETMAHRPYKEIQGNLLHKDFSPACLIRFYLSVLGLESTYPLSIRYVPGVLFQGLPGWEEIMFGAQSDWKFSNLDFLDHAA